MGHGTRLRYEKGCHCEECTAAKRCSSRSHAVKQRFKVTGVVRTKLVKLPITMIALYPNDVRHGTPKGYRDGGCRCAECCDAQERSRVYKAPVKLVKLKPIVQAKKPVVKENLGDIIWSLDRDAIEARRHKGPVVNWGEPMPFEKRSFDPEATRLRAGGSL